MVILRDTQVDRGVQLPAEWRGHNRDGRGWKNPHIQHTSAQEARFAGCSS